MEVYKDTNMIDSYELDTGRETYSVGRNSDIRLEVGADLIVCISHTSRSAQHPSCSRRHAEFTFAGVRVCDADTRHALDRCAFCRASYI